MDVFTCKQLMGGDGYYGDDHIDGIPDVIVIGESPDSLSNALEDGPVLGIMNPGDVDGNGIDDGHAVIITDFDAENGTVYYWDPETGDMDNGSVGDFLGGWGINGTKE